MPAHAHFTSNLREDGVLVVDVDNVDRDFDGARKRRVPVVASGGH